MPTGRGELVLFPLIAVAHAASGQQVQPVVGEPEVARMRLLLTVFIHHSWLLVDVAIQFAVVDGAFRTEMVGIAGLTRLPQVCFTIGALPVEDSVQKELLELRPECGLKIVRRDTALRFPLLKKRLRCAIRLLLPLPPIGFQFRLHTFQVDADHSYHPGAGLHREASWLFRPRIA